MENAASYLCFNKNLNSVAIFFEMYTNVVQWKLEIKMYALQLKARYTYLLGWYSLFDPRFSIFLLICALEFSRSLDSLLCSLWHFEVFFCMLTYGMYKWVYNTWITFTYIFRLSVHYSVFLIVFNKPQISILKF